MRIVHKREFTIEHERTMTIRTTNVSSDRICAACGEQVRFLTIDEAAIFRHTTARHIFRLVEAGRIHFIDVENGSLLVCFRSLAETEDGTELLSEKINLEKITGEK